MQFDYKFVVKNGSEKTTACRQVLKTSDRHILLQIE